MSRLNVLSELKSVEDIDALNEADSKALCKELLERNGQMSLKLSVIHTAHTMGRCMCYIAGEQETGD